MKISRWVKDRATLPRGWHSFDPRCECASCEARNPTSPYLKVKRAKR